MVARIINSLTVVAALLFATSALAQDIALQAVVDRSVVQENESFTYLLRAQGSTREEPDLSPLAADFDNRAGLKTTADIADDGLARR